MGTKYTITFDRGSERKFREVLSRLDESEYTIIKEIQEVPNEKFDKRDWDMETIIEMDPEACLTFRLGMKFVKIRRERSEEELAAEKERDERNTIRINVQVPMTDSGTAP